MKTKILKKSTSGYYSVYSRNKSVDKQLTYGNKSSEYNQSDTCQHQCNEQYQTGRTILCGQMRHQLTINRQEDVDPSGQRSPEQQQQLLLEHALTQEQIHQQQIREPQCRHSAAVADDIGIRTRNVTCYEGATNASNSDTNQIVALQNNPANVSGRLGSSTLEQYRLQQLYNYALSIERFRCPPSYTTAAAMAAVTACSHNNTNVLGNGIGVYGSQTNSNGHMLSLVSRGNSIANSSNNQSVALSMSLFPQRIFHPEDPKPQHSYIGLIAMAILSSSEFKLVLSDIYQYILDNYPYFRTRGPGWRNSIRHNLSLNDCFIKSGRSANGKGHYWAIHPANIDDFRKGDFRRRKAQRKVRKHMGLSVDDVSTDSSSPPPLDLSSTPPPISTHATNIPAIATSSILSSHHPLLPQQLTTAQQLASAAAQTHAAAFSYLLQHQYQHQQQIQHQQFNAQNYIGLNTLNHSQLQLQHFTGDNLSPHYKARFITTAQLPYIHNHPIHQQALITNHQPLTGFMSDEHTMSSTKITKNKDNVNRIDISGIHLNEDIHLSDDQRSSATMTMTSRKTESTVSNGIDSLHSHTRKRQFDVASLLAPDIPPEALTRTSTTTTTTLEQHTIITKLNLQHQQQNKRTSKQQQKIQHHLLIEIPEEHEDIVDVEQLFSDDELLDDELDNTDQLKDHYEESENLVTVSDNNISTIFPAVATLTKLKLHNIK